MFERIVKTLIIATLCLGAACQNQPEKAKKLVKIGNRVFTQDDVDGYSFTTRAYPHELPRMFPGDRRQATAMIETEALYRRIPWGFSRISARNTADWEWKQRYFPAQMYAMDVLSRNLGTSDDEISRYYESHKAMFKLTTKPPSDTSKKAAAAAKKDTVAYRPLMQVKDQIVKSIFLSRYKPDKAWLKKTFKDSLPDTATIQNQWFTFVRNNGQDFFLKVFYQEIYGSPMPEIDSLKQWFGEGKVVTPKDMDVIMNWVPEGRRANYKQPQGQKDLALWLLRWKVFSEKAKRSGFLSSKRAASAMEWAWKMQIVGDYVNSTLTPKAKAMVSIDTALCLYSYWDDKNAVTIPPDTAGVRAEVSRQFDRELGRMIDSLLYLARKQVGVAFLQNDWRDELDKNPAVLAHRADSLRDTGNVDESEKLYRTLTTDFSFSQASKKAFGELAKIQTEKQMYREAITNYRISMISGKDSEKLCNTFFMIGFIYDEYLNQPALAEVNYKWILKNTPKCELADDAEFMMLHLNEPMIRIEELRAEAKRQGRKVEDDQPIEGQPATAKATKADTTAKANPPAKPDAGAKKK